jgi:hypothetical protein
MSKVQRFDDGGQAFPLLTARGMSLRDYFAAKAMQGMLSAEHNNGVASYWELADAAYVIADKMIERREQ